MTDTAITNESDLSALLDRIDALELSIERKTTGGVVCRIKMETMLGDYGADGAPMDGDELRLLGKLITKVYDSSKPDDEEDDEASGIVPDVFAPIDLDD